MSIQIPLFLEIQLVNSKNFKYNAFDIRGCTNLLNLNMFWKGFYVSSEPTSLAYSFQCHFHSQSIGILKLDQRRILTTSLCEAFIHDQDIRGLVVMRWLQSKQVPLGSLGANFIFGGAKKSSPPLFFGHSFRCAREGSLIG